MLNLLILSLISFGLNTEQVVAQNRHLQFRQTSNDVVENQAKGKIAKFKAKRNKKNASKIELPADIKLELKVEPEKNSLKPLLMGASIGASGLVAGVLIGFGIGAYFVTKCVIAYFFGWW